MVTKKRIRLKGLPHSSSEHINQSLKITKSASDASQAEIDILFFLPRNVAKTAPLHGAV
jgi:hypothetical protein